MNLMKKKLLLFFLAIGAWTGAMSQDVGYIMRVNLVNGTVDEYLVADHPYVSFAKESITVSSSMVTTTYATNDVANYTFAEMDANDIEEVIHEESNVNMIVKYLDGETVEIRGIGNVQVTVYGVDGRKLNADIVRMENGVNVSLSALPSGTYIINIKNSKSVKVLKR